MRQKKKQMLPTVTSASIRTLELADVLHLHEVLTNDFAAAEDPISPPGVKSMPLLESAVHRQHTGGGGELKYRTACANAAALAYGICSNHPFHNGNKRTSLVAMLCHLDRNDLTFEEHVPHSELYDFMLKVARHGFSGQSERAGDRADLEVEAMTAWVRARTRRIEKSERLITFRQLKTLLGRRGFDFENADGNYIDIVKKSSERQLWGLLPSKTVSRRIMRIGNPGDGIEVSKHVIKDVRKKCGLTDEHGIDSAAFYGDLREPDFFIAKYRGTLRRLAKV